MKFIQQVNQKDEECGPQTVPYEEACSKYKYYKARTLKQHINTSDFALNIQMREHFLAIKKKYDMRRRAKKFRENQKI